jgi:hypothetical protein
MVFRSHWMDILERLHIDDSQTDALLAARSAALEQLRVIYEVQHHTHPFQVFLTAWLKWHIDRRVPVRKLSLLW